jgi:hypothetical protein
MCVADTMTFGMAVFGQVVEELWRFVLLRFSRLRETKRQESRFARRSRPQGERHGWRE